MLNNKFLTRGLVVLVALVTLFSIATRVQAVPYTVKSGDSLTGISKKFGTTPLSIVKSNPSKLLSVNTPLEPGDSLNVTKHLKKAAKKVTTQASKVKAAKKVSTTVTHKQAKKKTKTGWMTMEATAYDPHVAAGGPTYIPTGTGVAAPLDRFPKGTQLEIKYADGRIESRVVNDTGTFAATNPNQLDISMTNAEALQFGRQWIQVRVLA